MRSSRKATALAGALAISAALVTYVGPSAMDPIIRSSLTAAAASLTPATSNSHPASSVRVRPVSAPASDEEAARYQTCNLFRQMVEGLNYLSSDEQRQLMYDMAAVVQYTGDAALMRAVANMSQGALEDNPQQFVTGMRALSQICGVPYE